MKEKEVLKDIERDFHRLQKFSLFTGDEWKVYGFHALKKTTWLEKCLGMRFRCGSPQREWPLGASGKLISV